LAELSQPPAIRRYEREQPGDLLHFDIKPLARFDRPGHRVKCDGQAGSSPGAGWEFLHVAIDHHSRVAFAQILPEETSASAVSFLHASLEFFLKLSVQTKRVYSDNGACYRAHAMQAAVAALGLKQRFTRPYTPQTHGKAERFIQISLRSGAYAHAYHDSSQRADRIPNFLHNYNWHRPHHSLNLLPPVSRLRLDMNNLLSLHS
jgi:transposase InsO family protein